MDFSSSAQSHQRQQQQQDQQYGIQAYDPSQIQSYYYSSCYQQYQNSQQIQDYSSYYNAQYINGYDQQQQYSQPKPATQIIQPPGVSAPPQMPPQLVEGGVGAETVTASVPVPDQQNVNYMLPGLNPAAAAAVALLAQITQLAGAMDGPVTLLAGLQGQQWPVMGGPELVSGPGPVSGPEQGYYGPRPMHPMAGRSRYRGGSKRGGGSFRGRGQGITSNHPSRTGGSFHESGGIQGMGGSCHFKQHGVSSSLSEPSAAAEKVESQGEVAEPLAGTGEREAKADVPPQTSAPPNRKVASNQQPTRGVRCERCRVDCTSLEMLEQHKDGKRHKKNLQRSQLLKIGNKPVAETCKEKMPVGDSNPEVTPKAGNIMDGEENKCSLPENLPTEVVGSENKMETQQPNDKAEKSNSSGVTQSGGLVSQPSNQRHNLKRKMKGGRGGKRVKTVDTPRGSLKPPKPKTIIPSIGDLCNVRCDTKEVFDHHLSGKKHISKLKLFEVHQAMYGPIGLQALYPPSSIAQNLFHQRVPRQTFYSSQGSYPPLGADMPPQSHNEVPAEIVTVPSLVQNPSTQVSNGTPQFVDPNALCDTRQQAASVEPEPKQGA